MFNIIYGYIFKYTRQHNRYTLQKESDITGIEVSYLNKVENNLIIPSERILRSYFKYFDISNKDIIKIFSSYYFIISH